MMAWVSPELMVRSTPCRIGLAPSSVVTETCRSWISSLLMTGFLLGFFGGLGFQAEVDVAVAEFDRVGRHRSGGGRPGRLAGAQVEHRPVQPALQRAVLDVALRERHGGVGALVVEGEHFLSLAHEHDRRAVDVGGHGLRLRQVVERADAQEIGVAHPAIAPPASSLATMASVSSSRRSSEGIFWMISLKKPLTTRRRASS